MTSALFALSYVKSLLGRVVSEERAQDAFEYLLVIGGVTVAVIIAVATPAGGAMIGGVIDGVCAAIGTIPSIPALGDCTP